MNRLFLPACDGAGIPFRRAARLASFVMAFGLFVLLTPGGAAHAQSENPSSPAPPHSASRSGKPNPGQSKTGQRNVGAIGTGRPATAKQANGQMTVTGGATPNMPARGLRPAALPPITPPPVPVITYFTQDTKEWIKAGQVVYITLQGTAGGQAAFRVEGFADRVPMRETAPGRYVGSWAAPAANALALPAANVTGELSVNGTPAVALQTSRPLAIDTIAPRIERALPADAQTVKTLTPTISADFTDMGSGVDAGSVRLIVNGRDLTGEANVTTEGIMYKPVVALVEGEQTVQIRISDRAGNKYQMSWRFTVSLK